MQNYNSFINEEVGIRNIKEIIGDMRTAEIYFHKDLDGVTSALAMKYFLETYYQVKTVDAHQIQYGGMEFAIKNHKEGNLTVLVDFAHGKGAKFKIQSDHHDKQVGADKQGTYFKPARSNVEIISGEISYSPAFTSGDVELIRTVDSANFLIYNITPKDVQNSIFQFKRELSGEKNRFMMGFVVNRLLLAYKNKRITIKSMDGKRNHINRNILECLTLDSTGRLYSMFNNLKHYINSAKTNDKLGRLATPEEITDNLNAYITRMKNYSFIEDPNTGDVTEYDPTNWRHKNLLSTGAKIGKGVNFDEDYKIVTQYGGGSMIKAGSYDRYVVFKRFYVSLESIKKEFETSQDWKSMAKAEGEDYEGVGFKFSDLEAFYKDCLYAKKDGKIDNVDINEPKLRQDMNTLFTDLTPDQKFYLSNIKIPAWELIIRNSGGHPSITNITGFNFLKYNKPALKIAYNTEKYVDVLKTMAKDFVNVLKDKIDVANKGEQVEYNTKGVELLGQDTNENFEYHVVDKKTNQPTQVSRDEFVKAGSSKGMKTDRKSLMTIDNTNKKIIAKFESYKNK